MLASTSLPREFSASIYTAFSCLIISYALTRLTAEARLFSVRVRMWVGTPNLPANSNSERWNAVLLDWLQSRTGLCDRSLFGKSRLIIVGG